MKAYDSLKQLVSKTMVLNQGAAKAFQGCHCCNWVRLPRVPHAQPDQEGLWNEQAGAPHF